MNVFDYLISLPNDLLSDLWNDSSTCLAIFRSLPNLAKNYVLRLIFLDEEEGILLSQLDSWVNNREDEKHQASIQRLLDLKLCKVVSIPSKNATEKKFVMNPIFKKHLKIALQQTEMPPWALSVPSNIKTPTIESLDAYSQRCWDALLQFMIGSPTFIPTAKIADIFVKSGLMQEDTNSLCITNVGFQFLLQDTYTQIWTLLLAYIRTIEIRDPNMNKKEVLSFLFQLSFLTFGKGYEVKNLTPTQQNLVHDLREFGILYQKNKTSKCFYPTRLAMKLSSKATKEIEKAQDGYIILESNYRIYAYTSSKLQKEILSLFCRIRYELPNLVMGFISRESIRDAFMNGITADQIIQYLQQNAHRELKKKTPVLPETVVDQIRLWEGERSRISFQNVVLYDFNNVNTFHKFLDFARKNEILLWHSPLPEKGKTGIQILKIAVKVGKEDIIKSFQKSIK